MTQFALNRRASLQAIAGAVAAVATARGGVAMAQTAAPAAGPFTLPPLGYAYEALEPHIDTATMRFHHQNHHNAFVTNLNNMAKNWDGLAVAARNPVPLLSSLASVPEAMRTGVRNSLGGHWNHTFFWELMTPGGAKAPSGDLLSAINATFGSVEKMQEMFNQAAMTRFGSGWAWLAVNKDRKLQIVNTPYQDTPHMDLGGRGAVIGIDVWEHAYYLKHQYRRADYVKAWWNTVNWDKAAAGFKALTA
jgi:Fe-Mn family superoxide dismutase